MGSSSRPLFEEWFERLWKRGDASAITELRADVATGAGLAERPLTNADFAAFHARILAAFRDTDVKIERFIEQGAQVALSVRFTGTTKDGRRVDIRGMGFAHVEDGKIVESENLWDVASLSAQLGGKSTPTARTLDEAIAQLD